MGLVSEGRGRIIVGSGGIEGSRIREGPGMAVSFRVFNYRLLKECIGLFVKDLGIDMNGIV